MLFRGGVLCGGVLLLGCGAQALPVTGNATTNVAIDDEIASICATKADGQYRCWNTDGTVASAAPLPDAAYVRVQLARTGLVGLTRTGSLQAVNLAVAPDLPPIATFRAFNMWGSQSLCLRSGDGAFLYGTYNPDPNFFPDGSRWYREEGPFIDTFCAFEGLWGAVRRDGTAWGPFPAPGGASGWKQIVLGAGGINCGLSSTGEVKCTALSAAETDPPFTYPSARYVQVAATFYVACALRADGGITCLRFDGRAVLAPPGSYVFLDAGRDLLCAIRNDGTSACFRQNGKSMPSDLTDKTITAFEALPRTGDEGW